ncbi:hypothetical protein ABF87_10740 [Nitrosomonas sp. JL21]|nr:hypothetical protein [Nitrosomonas sp. JL21]
MKIIALAITQRINANKAFVATKKVQTLKNNSHGHSIKLISFCPYIYSLNQAYRMNLIHSMTLKAKKLHSMIMRISKALRHIVFSSHWRKIHSGILSHIGHISIS